MAKPEGSAIAELYEAILSPGGWSAALQHVARSVEATGLVVFPPYAQELSRTYRQFPASTSLREPLTAFIDEGWWRDDHRARRARPLMAGGRRVIFEQDVASEEDRRRLPVYHELYRRFDMPWFAAAMFEADDLIWSATFLRSERQGPFLKADAAALTDLRGHLQHAVSLAIRTSSLVGGAMIDLLDLFEQGAALLDRRGHVVHANQNARLAFGAGLDVANGRLVASDPTTNGAVQRLVDGAASPVFTPEAAGPVSIARAGARPLVVEALPLAKGAVDDPFQVLRSILLITDLDRIPAATATRLREVFGLTRAEARLAARMAVGEDIDSAAAFIGITRQTARSQLKAIFAKTDTHRQAELVALLARLRG